MFPSFILIFIIIVVHFSKPCFPARILTDFITVGDPESATWQNFARFVDVSKGSHVAELRQLKKYFQRFGYLPRADSKNFTDVFDNRFESAVNMYQAKLGLQVTGKLDSDTIGSLMSPRCGVSDVAHGLHNTRRFSYFYGKPRWFRKSPMEITYAFSSKYTIDYLNYSEIGEVFRRAFSRWSEVIPVTFVQSDKYSTADVKIGFYGGDHGDGQSFDGVLGVLAHAFSPENGRFHLDKAETWSVDFKRVKSKVAVDLESVATHEIGHVLGLAHSSVREAVMYPSLRPRTRKVELKLDDVEGVQALYGSNPNFDIGSLLESETFSSGAIGLECRLCKWGISLILGVIVFAIG